MPHVRIYLYKEVETGSQVYENLIWETRASSRLFGKDGVGGLVNVDLTPETAARLATALGTALKRGARRRRQPRLGAGLPDDQAGDDLGPERGRNRRRRPARLATRGQPPRAQDAGVRRRGPRRLEPPRPRGDLHPHLRAARDPAHARPAARGGKNFTRQELRRVAAGGVGSVCTRRGCARATPRTCSARSTRRRSASATSASSSTTATRRLLRTPARARPARRGVDRGPRLLRRRARRARLDASRSRSGRRSGS